MKIHCVQHVPFEGSANIEAWARDRSHDLSNTLLFEGKSLPEMEEFDWLIIMGGPMNIYEEDKYPWLRKEKEFIKRAIASDKIVLGICLGAQLMADALGGNVHKNMHREIGWFPVNLTPAAKKSRIFGVLPERFMAMHWHGDTFDLPPGALHAAESQACSNQAFELEKSNWLAVPPGILFRQYRSSTTELQRRAGRWPACTKSGRDSCSFGWTSGSSQLDGAFFGQY
jgi:GMP synthase-like glutamine amidotransferase